MKRLIAGFAAAIASGVIGISQALAEDGVTTGPHDGGIGMVAPADALARQVHFFYNGVLTPIIVTITLVVLALLLWVVFRYNAKANPVPKKFSHNTTVEIIWTGVPILILLGIALFSFDLLFKEDIIPDGKQIVATADGSTSSFSFNNDFPPSRMVKTGDHVRVFASSAGDVRGLVQGKDYTLDGLGSAKVTVNLKETPAAGEKIVVRAGRSLIGAPGHKEIVLAPTLTIKAIGFQWGWTYSYPDYGDFEFTANMLPEDQTTPELYHFETDHHVVVPVGETIRVVTTSRDVIHSWAVPPFTIKIDAIPGRLNETWFKADKPGMYYGQCSEICGVRHSAMPISVEAVSRADFEKWVDQQRIENGMEPMFSGKVASAEAAADKTLAAIDAAAVQAQ
ncbi:MAG: cytochrome c oxidase subunit II transmembrane domain-containing protein [Parvularculaceae bacterium]